MRHAKSSQWCFVIIYYNLEMITNIHYLYCWQSIYYKTKVLSNVLVGPSEGAKFGITALESKNFVGSLLDLKTNKFLN